MVRPSNIDCFNRIVATCLVKLYEAFPVPIKIDAFAVSCECMNCYENTDEDWYEIYRDVSTASIQFLADEGFIRYRDKERYTGFIDVQLSMKGLAVLGSTPTSVDSKKTIVEMLRNSIKEGTETAISNVTGDLLSAAFLLGIKAVRALIP